MSAATDVLLDLYSRVRGSVHRAGEGLSAEQLAVRLDPDANSIGWLLWHIARGEDEQVADVAGREPVWTADGWDARFDLPGGSGYGHTSKQVGQVRGFAADLVLAYYDAVHERSLGFIRSIDDEDLARVVDEGWDPPVTLGVRLVSIADDGIQHAGQAAFVRGVLERR